MKLGTQLGLGADHTVLDGDPAPPPKKGHMIPNFRPMSIVASPHSRPMCCGQTAGWIKMALGRGVGLGPGHIVLDGDPALNLPTGHSTQFSVPFYCGQTVAHLSYCRALVNQYICKKMK